MSYTIPMGPYHPGLEEPYKLDLVCEDETVIDAKLHVGFNFRTSNIWPKPATMCRSSR